MEKWKRAYLAGFFDADGSVGGYQGRLVHITIGQKYFPEVLETMQGWTGVGQVVPVRSRPNNYRWRINQAGEVRYLLQLIQPFCIRKRDEIEVALEIAEWNVKAAEWHRDRMNRPPTTRFYYEGHPVYDLVKELKALKKRS